MPGHHPSQKHFLVGKVVGFHGLRGEVKVRPATNSPEILRSIKEIYATGGAHFDEVTLNVETLAFEKRMLYLSFIGYPDRTSVQHLEGAQLFVDESELEPLEEEEFWVKDLVGMEVFTTDGKSVGKIIDIIYGGNDILEIRSEEHPPGKSILIPFVKTLVPNVDMNKRRVEVIDVPGLLDPQ